MWTDGSSCNKGLGSCEKLSHLLPIKLTHQDPDTSFPTQGIGERRKERGGVDILLFSDAMVNERGGEGKGRG